MYAGHFAAALAIKARIPRAPTWGLVAGVGVCDILFGALAAAGYERVHMTPGQAPGFALEWIDVSHSLATSLLWSVLFGVAFWGRDAAVRVALGLAVFSHFLLDLLMHPGDLALWPDSATHVGFGLWTRFPRGWWFIELAFIALCAVYYLARARRSQAFGRHAAWAVAVVLVLHVVNSPWLSATR